MNRSFRIMIGYKFTTIVKKNMKILCSKPLNPLVLIVFFALLGLVGMFVVDDVDSGVEMFLALIGTGISLAVVQTAIIQNAIQKDNIKLQLFDKRYQILQTILDSMTLVRRDNWDRYMLFGAGDDTDFINRQIIDTEERLYKATQLSISIFDSELVGKIEKVNNAYCAVASSYKTMLMTNLHTMEDQAMRDQFMGIVAKHFISPAELDYDKLDSELKEALPKIYLPLLEFARECDNYINLMADLKILGDFNKYVIIRDLDS